MEVEDVTVEGAPHQREGHARYRQWFDEFPLTGYTFAMPVVYPWDEIWDWYDFANADYRWFYNMLRVGSNAGEHTPPEIPIITFIHWHTVHTDKGPEGKIPQLRAEKYQELLWHLLLRGHDGLFVWSPWQEAVEESRLAHQVYAASLEYGAFLSHGEPITFEVPPQPGPLVSGLKLGDRVLVRRTDFDATEAPVTLMVDGHPLAIPHAEGRCLVLTMRR